MAKFIPHLTEHTRRKKKLTVDLHTVCMDLESDLSEEKKKDEDSIKDTLNECKNEVGNIGSELMFCSSKHLFEKFICYF